MRFSRFTISKMFILLPVAVVLFWTNQVAQAGSITSEGVIKLVNQARLKESLDPLVINDKLAKAAMDKADDMLQHDYFAHTSPQGATPWDWITKNKYDYKYAGENLAMGFNSAEKQQQAWMDSATHRQNIMNQHYQEIGVAVKNGVIEGKKTTVVVQEFGSRTDFASSKKVDATPAQASNGEVVLGAQKVDKIRAGAAGSLWLAIIGGFLIAGYLAVDSLVVEYLAIQKRRKQKSALAFDAEEDVDSLKALAADAKKFQVIYLHQMKPRK